MFQRFTVAFSNIENYETIMVSKLIVHLENRHFPKMTICGFYESKDIHVSVFSTFRSWSMLQVRL